MAHQLATLPSSAASYAEKANGTASSSRSTSDDEDDGDGDGGEGEIKVLASRVLDLLDGTASD